MPSHVALRSATNCFAHSLSLDLCNQHLTAERAKEMSSRITCTARSSVPPSARHLPPYELRIYASHRGNARARADVRVRAPYALGVLGASDSELL